MEGAVSSEIQRGSPEELKATRSINENELSEAGRDTLLVALKQVRENEAVIIEKDRYIGQLQKSIKELAKQLKGVAEFIDLREDIEERLEIMEKFHREEIAKFKSQAQDARLDMLENKVKLRREEEILKKNHERDVAIKATELLDRRTREVNDQNFELVKDKLLMARDMETARAQCAVLTTENASLRRKAQLATGAESELLVRSVAQKKQIALLKKQIKTTEENIEKIVKEYDQRLAKQEKMYEKQVLMLTQERDEARHDAHVFRTELKRLREASSKVTNLHSELQLFFHEALREVRLEVFEERRRAIMGAPCGTNSNKALNTSSSALRLESQPRLMITDVYGTASRNRSEWATDKRGFPVLVSKNSSNPSLLPPIPGDNTLEGSGGSLTATSQSGGSGGRPIQGPAGFLRCVRNVNVDYVISDSNEEEDSQGRLLTTGEGEAKPPEEREVGEGECVEYGTTTKNPHAIPSAPSLTELQQIDIRQLTWSEKERVLYYLFKRLQQTPSGGAHRKGTAGLHSGGSTERDVAALSATPNTFLTQE